jgi:hypothetical protein
MDRSFRGTRAADASLSVWCSYNQVGQWNWNTHGSDWIYQGGPDSSAVKNSPYFNQWEDMDDSPVSWHVTEARRVNAKCALHCVLWPFDVILTGRPLQPVPPLQFDSWLTSVGGNLY